MLVQTVTASDHGLPRRQQLSIAAGWLALLFLPVVLGAQISPGKLSAPHAELDGNSQCTACHEARSGVAPRLCLDCHQLLAERIDSGLGLHSQSGYDRCDRCHIEHHGRDFELIYWGEEGRDSFDHALTGWPLAGAHGERSCRDCHQASSIAAPQPLLAQDKALSRTFLGLTTDCLSCHADEHRAQFAKDSCASCHPSESWLPLVGFDHAATRFPLTGEHTSADCAACHPEVDDPQQESETFTQFTDLASAQCSACHQDPHQGTFGATCSQCHSTAGWAVLGNMNHQRTQFPLTGRHRAVGCSDCHGPNEERETALFTGLAFAQCSDCHQDPHEDRLGPACNDCHSTADWSAFDSQRFDHGQTRFPLAGAHQVVACEDCHAAGAPLSIADFDQCTTCHQDTHAGQFLDRGDSGACESCHSVERFLPSSFDVDDHQETNYPLAGAHLAIPCIACHRSVDLAEIPGLSALSVETGLGSVQAVQFRFVSSRCTECHDDPHRGEVDRWLAEDGCETCHTADSWLQSVFLHGKTDFPLRGRHQEVGCIDCHPIVDQGAPEERVQMVGISTTCTDCHETPHGGQFESDGQSAGCERCHLEEGWEILFFAHDRDTDFPLEGVHAEADCEACHTTDGRFGPGVISYVETPAACEWCHARAPGESPPT